MPDLHQTLRIEKHFWLSTGGRSVRSEHLLAGCIDEAGRWVRSLLTPLRCRCARTTWFHRENLDLRFEVRVSIRVAVFEPAIPRSRLGTPHCPTRSNLSHLVAVRRAHLFSDIVQPCGTFCLETRNTAHLKTRDAAHLTRPAPRRLAWHQFLVSVLFTRPRAMYTVCFHCGLRAHTSTAALRQRGGTGMASEPFIPGPPTTCSPRMMVTKRASYCCSTAQHVKWAN
jgi:hypothetical protein